MQNNFRDFQLAYLDSTALPKWDRSTLNPTALRKAKIVYDFGLSESNRVKRKNWLFEEQVFIIPLERTPAERGSKNIKG